MACFLYIGKEKQNSLVEKNVEIEEENKIVINNKNNNKQMNFFEYKEKMAFKQKQKYDEIELFLKEMDKHNEELNQFLNSNSTKALEEIFKGLKNKLEGNNIEEEISSKRITSGREGDEAFFEEIKYKLLEKVGKSQKNLMKSLCSKLLNRKVVSEEKIEKKYIETSSIEIQVDENMLGIVKKAAPRHAFAEKLIAEVTKKNKEIEIAQHQHSENFNKLSEKNEILSNENKQAFEKITLLNNKIVKKKGKIGSLKDKIKMLEERFKSMEDSNTKYFSMVKKNTISNDDLETKIHSLKLINDMQEENIKEKEFFINDLQRKLNNKEELLIFYKNNEKYNEMYSNKIESIKEIVEEKKDVKKVNSSELDSSFDPEKNIKTKVIVTNKNEVSAKKSLNKPMHVKQKSMNIQKNNNHIENNNNNNNKKEQNNSKKIITRDSISQGNIRGSVDLRRKTRESLKSFTKNKIFVKNENFFKENLDSKDNNTFSKKINENISIPEEKTKENVNDPRFTEKYIADKLQEKINSMNEKEIITILFKKFKEIPEKNRKTLSEFIIALLKNNKNNEDLNDLLKNVIKIPIEKIQLCNEIAKIEKNYKKEIIVFLANKYKIGNLSSKNEEKSEISSKKNKFHLVDSQKDLNHSFEEEAINDLNLVLKTENNVNSEDWSFEKLNMDFPTDINKISQKTSISKEISKKEKKSQKILEKTLKNKSVTPNKNKRQNSLTISMTPSTKQQFVSTSDTFDFRLANTNLNKVFKNSLDFQKPNLQKKQMNLTGDDFYSKKAIEDKKFTITDYFNKKNDEIEETEEDEEQSKMVSQIYANVKKIKLVSQENYTKIKHLVRYPFRSIHDKMFTKETNDNNPEDNQITFSELKNFYKRLLHIHKRCGNLCSHLHRFYSKVGIQLKPLQRTECKIGKIIINKLPKII